MKTRFNDLRRGFLMRRSVIVSLLVALFTLPALACEPAPTSTPAASPTPTVTPGPVEPSSTPTAPSTASPTPTPAAGPIDLGVSAGDAYSPQAMAVDGPRGLAYVVSGDGDAAESEDSSVLSVVDVAQGEVRATVALPHPFKWRTSMVLAPAGDRLFIAGGDDRVMLVVATGTGGESLGEVLSVEFGVRAVALDPASLRLYTAGASRIRVFDANTFEELQSVEVPDTLPLPPAEIFFAVNPQTSRLYLGSPDSDIVTVLHTDDLHRVADILPGARPTDVIASPDSPQAYLLIQRYGDGIDEVAVIEGNQVIKVWQAQEGIRIQSVVPDDVRDGAFLWEMAGDLSESRLRAIDPASGQTATTVSLPTHNIREATVDSGRLYLVTSDGVFATIAVNTGTLDSAVPLGVRLQDAIVDEETDRLFVIDSAGTVHVLDAASLRKVDTWPRVIGTGIEVFWPVRLSLVRGRLFVPDANADETVVLNTATGQRVATIPKAGQVTLDPTRNRLFVTRQGVFIVDIETYAVVDSIEDTVRKTQFMGEPSAMAAEYDAEHDLLFVTMTNNSAGSSASTWLLVYDGDTLQRLDTEIKTDQQFLSGLAIDTTTDRVYVASSFPETDLAVFTIRGQLLTRLQHLSGRLFLDAAQGRLYVAGWGGLVTLDTATHDPSASSGLSVADYRRLPSEHSEFLVIDVVRERLYRTKSSSANLLVLPLRPAEPTTPQTVDRLPPTPVADLAVSDDGRVFAVSDKGAVYRRGGVGWQLVDETLPPIEVPAIYPAPGAPSVIFAHLKQWDHYGQSFGVFRSVDGGRTWAPADRGLKDFDVRDMALSPDFATDKTAFLLAGDGIFRSTDGGDTWQRVSDVIGQEIALASTVSGPPAFLVLAPKPDTYDQMQVYAPTDAAGSVEQISTIGAEVYGDHALALSPNFTEDGTAIAGLYRAGLFLSQNFGQTWRQLPPRLEAFSPLYTIHYSPNFASDRTVYALLAPSYFGEDARSRLYRSTDGGQTWQQAIDAHPLISALAMGPNGQLWIGDAKGGVRRLDPGQLAWEIALEPTPTPVPTPAPPPAGFYQPEGAFADLWATDPEVRRALGWAAEPNPRQVSTAFQTFEGGVMIWRGDTRTIYVLYDDGPSTPRQTRDGAGSGQRSWDGFEDTWTPDEPERDPAIQPPGREQPVRGFGKVWRKQPGVRDRLGWALQAEEGYASSVQGFERGTAIGIGSSVYVLTRVAGEPATWLKR